jgi:MFS transporter, ACDE family, multidrug resistance protein
LESNSLLIKRLIPLYLGAVVGPMGGFGIVTLIPVLAQAWSMDLATISLSITLYMAPFILIQIFSGSIAHLFNVQKTLLIGFATYAAGGILSATATSFSVFMAGRIIQGSGAAFLSPILMALIGELVPPKHIGKAMGALGLAYTIGVTMGPLISGLVEVRYGWQGFFFFLSGVSIATAALFLIWCRDIGTQPKQRHSILEIFPLIRAALSQPGIFYLSFAAFALFFAYIGILTFTADYMKTLLKIPSDRVGFLLSLTGFSGIIVSPMAGILGDRFGRNTILMIGMAIIFIVMSLMTALDFHYPRYMVLFLLLGVGSSTAWTSLNTMAVQLSVTLRNPVTSLYNVIKFSGYAVSPLILSFFYGHGRLKTVQSACVVVILLSSFLAMRTKGKQASL